MSSRYEILKQYVASGLSQAEIARRIGITRERARQLINETGLYDEWLLARPSHRNPKDRVCRKCGQLLIGRQLIWCSLCLPQATRIKLERDRERYRTDEVYRQHRYRKSARGIR